MEIKSMVEGRKKTKRLATLVGCNYAGTRNELRGGINDVRAMRDALVARFGFAPADIAVLTDDLDERGAEAVLPTGSNIKRALAGMIDRASPGDVLFFHYSGHGTLVPPHHGAGGGCGGRDEEAIVPCDFNLVTDLDFRQLVDRVPPGATFTMVSDSCHSGGLIDQEKEQIGPSAIQLPGEPAAPASIIRRTRRFLPYGALLNHVSGVSGVASHHHVADHLVALFGADASAKFHDRGGSSTAPPAPARLDEGILMSGCQTDETSADVAADDEDDGRACGAFSSAVQSVLASHPAPLSNREMVARAREVLRELGFEQHPCLYCSDVNAEAPFLSQEETSVGAAAPAAMTSSAL